MRFSKKIIYVIALLFIISSCRKKRTGTPKNNKIIVTGQIDNLKDTSVSFSYYTFSFLQGLKKQLVKINSQGDFRMELLSKKPLRGWFSFGKVPKTEKFHFTNIKGKDTSVQTETFDPRMIYLYLEPNDSLHVQLNVNDIQGSYKFSGIGAINNIFINKEEYKFNSYKQKYLRNYYNVTYLNPNSYKRNINNIYQQKIEFINDFNKKHSLSKKLVDNYINNYSIERVAKKVNYPLSHANFTNKKNTKLPDNYFDFLSNVKTYGSISKYGLGYYYNMKSILKKKYELSQEVSKESSNFEKWLKTQLPEKERYEFLAYELSSNFTYDIYKNFGENSPFPQMAKIVREKYKDYEGMLEGAPIPNIVLEKPNDSTLSINDLSGKFVYIDLWATWCGPCIKEIPYLKKVSKRYKNKNIVFVSISMDSDSDKDKWRNFINQRDLTGVQLHANSENQKIINSFFKVKTIPRFILIGPKSKIITSYAPRPSDPKLIELFNKYGI